MPGQRTGCRNGELPGFVRATRERIQFAHPSRRPHGKLCRLSICHRQSKNSAELKTRTMRRFLTRSIKSFDYLIFPDRGSISVCLEIRVGSPRKIWKPALRGSETDILIAQSDSQCRQAPITMRSQIDSTSICFMTPVCATDALKFKPLTRPSPTQ